MNTRAEIELIPRPVSYGIARCLKRCARARAVQRDRFLCARRHMTFESLWPPRPLLTRPKRPPYTTDVLSRLSGFRINNTARTTDRRGRLRPPAVRADPQQLYLAVCGQAVFWLFLRACMAAYGLCGFVRTLRDARGPVGIVRDGWRARGSVEGPWECERSWGCAWLRGASDGCGPSPAPVLESFLTTF